MNFKEARAKLKEISGGRYRSLSYEVTDPVEGTPEIRCSVYIDGFNYQKGKTWEEALMKMKQEIEDSVIDDFEEIKI